MSVKVSGQPQFWIAVEYKVPLVSASIMVTIDQRELATDGVEPPDVEHLCEKCGKKMRLTHSLPGTDILPAMQAFRCDSCGRALATFP
jgi:hypothetical protein